jgi:putative transcriptional regulator
MAPGSRIDLTNQFLIAMPGMADDTFAGTVVYLCEHSERGALGLVINKPIDIKLKNLFEKVELPLDRVDFAEQPVFFGGPVQTERGFVLHSPVGEWGSTLAVNTRVGLTTSKDILEAVSAGKGPGKIVVSLGYAGWAPGQLESELAQNAWLSVAADPEVIFDLPFEERLAAAMALLGVDFATLSESAGHA